jgi:hypothetical protein
MKKNYLSWAISGVFLIIVAIVLINDINMRQNIQQLSARVSQIAVSLNNTPVAVQPATPTNGAPAVVAPVAGHCPVVAVDKTNNAVTLGGQSTALITLAPGEVVREAKLSDDCKYLAWNTYQPRTPSGSDVTLGAREFTLNVNIIALDGSGSRTVESQPSGPIGMNEVPDFGGYDISLAHFFPDRLVIELNLSGDNSPGPGYYTLGLTGLEVYDIGKQKMISYGGEVEISPDGSWAVTTDQKNTISIVNLESGALDYSTNIAKGPDIYDYSFSPDGKYLVHAEIPGKMNQQGMEYIGPSSIYVQQLVGTDWSTIPTLLLSSKSGAPYVTEQWIDATHVAVLRSGSTDIAASDAGEYSLDVTNGKLTKIK